MGFQTIEFNQLLKQDTQLLRQKHPIVFAKTRLLQNTPDRPAIQQFRSREHALWIFCLFGVTCCGESLCTIRRDCRTRPVVLLLVFCLIGYSNLGLSPCFFAASPISSSPFPQVFHRRLSFVVPPYYYFPAGHYPFTGTFSL